MKKILSIFLTLAMLLSFAVSPALAENTSAVTAEIDYVGETISVTYTTNLDYNMYVNVYMAPADKKVSVFTDYTKAVRMDLAQCPASSAVTVEFKLGADIESGYYDFYAAPSGKTGINGYAKIQAPVYIISDTDRKDIISEINSASEDIIAEIAYERLKEALGFEEESYPEWKKEYLYAMKKSDYKGAYSSVGDVLAAWNAADALYNIRNAEEGEEKAAVDVGTSALGTDTENSDYTDFNEEFLERYLTKLESRNVVTVSDNLVLYNECLAVTAINERSNNDKAKAFEQYAKALGIEDILDDIDDADPYKVARHMEGFTADTPKEIKDKIKSVISALESSSDSGSSGGGGGGGGGGSRGGSGGVVGGATISNELLGADHSVKGKFSDVSDSHWAKLPVESLAAMNILNGYADGTFGPDKIVTREEFVKMIISAFAIPVQKSDASFADVSSDFWAAEYIYTAEANGIITGISSEKFGVGQPITRQDMAVIMSRVITYKAISVGSGSASFADEALIADYAAESVASLAGAGIVNGLPDGSFNPLGSLTRAEAAKVIYELVIR